MVSNIGLIVTGDLGHRNIDPYYLINSITKIKKVMPNLRTALVTSRPIDSALQEACKDSFDYIDSIETDSIMSLEVSYWLKSILIQANQVRNGLNFFPETFDFFIRIRTDWIINDVKRFKDTLEKCHTQNTFGFLSFSTPRMPYFPMPYQFNDLVMIGSRSIIENFFTEIPDNEIRELNRKSKFFDRNFYFSDQSIQQTSEQILWRKFLNIEPQDTDRALITFKDLDDSWLTLSKSSKYSYKDLGLFPPNSQISKYRLNRFFYGESLYPQHKTTKIILLSLAYFIANFSFFIHPHWIIPRLRFLSLKIFKK